jgi:hypothetical protein
MTEKTTEPAADTPDSVTSDVTADNANGSDIAANTVPYGSLHEERQKRKAAETQLEAMATEMLKQVPEDLRGLIPESLPPLERVAWFNSAKATGIFDKSASVPDVPRTDSSQPRMTPPPSDLQKLPPGERMKLGYGGGKA